MDRFKNLRCMALVVGNARSGSTLLGAVLDGHPNMVVANETQASMNFWRGLDGAAILAEIIGNAESNAATGRPSEGYHFQVGPPPSQKGTIHVVGDKIWNPATLLLHGDHGLILSIQQRLGVPVRVIHVVRNPFDTISTMHRRSGAPLSNRIRWYFMHCEAAAALGERLPSDSFVDSHHEDLLGAPRDELARLCGFLGVPLESDHVAAVEQRLFSSPRHTRNDVAWDRAAVDEVLAGIARFPFLARYAAGDTPRAVP